MQHWIQGLDQLLRGEATRPDSLREGYINIPIGGLSVVVVVLAMIYGLCMGSYSLFKVIDPAVLSKAPRYMQLIASTVKVPALYILTLAVTFPSLYVFNALVGSRLTMLSVLRLLVASLAVNLAVLASLGPIVAFFSVSTESYSFMVLFLLQTLNRLTIRTQEEIAVAEAVGATPSGEEAEQVESEQPIDEPQPEAPLSPEIEPSALDATEGHVLRRHVKLVFRCWVVVFALVGAQMGWVLRPFVGSPHEPFAWFRSRDSNFFEAVIRTLQNLLGIAG